VAAQLPSEVKNLALGISDQSSRISVTPFLDVNASSLKKNRW